MKSILLTGTRKKSIGRFIGKEFYKLGWDVWIYSKNAIFKNEEMWHERKCDVSSEKDIENLLKEISSLDISVQLADEGDIHVPLEDLREDEIKKFFDAKVVGSLIISKKLLEKSINQKKPIKLIWCCGKTSKKPKQTIIYSLSNIGISNFINELNRHYPKELEAYYLPTTLISPSTIGDKYIKKYGGKELAEHPSVISDKIIAIAKNKVRTGIVKMEEASI